MRLFVYKQVIVQLTALRLNTKFSIFSLLWLYIYQPWPAFRPGTTTSVECACVTFVKRLGFSNPVIYKRYSNFTRSNGFFNMFATVSGNEMSSN